MLRQLNDKFELLKRLFEIAVTRFKLLLNTSQNTVPHNPQCDINLNIKTEVELH